MLLYKSLMIQVFWLRMSVGIVSWKMLRTNNSNPSELNTIWNVQRYPLASLLHRSEWLRLWWDNKRRMKYSGSNLLGYAVYAFILFFNGESNMTLSSPFIIRFFYCLFQSECFSFLTSVHTVLSICFDQISHTFFLFSLHWF